MDTRLAFALVFISLLVTGPALRVKDTQNPFLEGLAKTVTENIKATSQMAGAMSDVMGGECSQCYNDIMTCNGVDACNRAYECIQEKEGRIAECRGSEEGTEKQEQGYKLYENCNLKCPNLASTLKAGEELRKKGVAGTKCNQCYSRISSCTGLSECRDALDCLRKNQGSLEKCGEDMVKESQRSDETPRKNAVQIYQECETTECGNLEAFQKFGGDRSSAVTTCNNCASDVNQCKWIDTCRATLDCMIENKGSTEQCKKELEEVSPVTKKTMEASYAMTLYMCQTYTLKECQTSGWGWNFNATQREELDKISQKVRGMKKEASAKEE